MSRNYCWTILCVATIKKKIVIWPVILKMCDTKTDEKIREKQMCACGHQKQKISFLNQENSATRTTFRNEFIYTLRQWCDKWARNLNKIMWENWSSGKWHRLLFRGLEKLQNIFVVLSSSFFSSLSLLLLLLLFLLLLLVVVVKSIKLC